MRILFVGDVVGQIGRKLISEYLPQLKSKLKPQVTIVNGENATDMGRGIDEKIYKGFLQAGADVVTLGNHAFDNNDIHHFIDKANNLIRPANFPENTTPGRGLHFVTVNQSKLAVINLQGTALMEALDNPFLKADQLIEEAKKVTSNIFIDFHAETTSEKQALATYLDGRVSAVVGTHTHVQTNDARLLPGGTAYLTDVGMTGPYESILGMKEEGILKRYLTKMPSRFVVQDQGPGQVNACLINIDPETGQSRSIKILSFTDQEGIRD